VVASRNIAWTKLESGRWTGELGQIIGTDASELRRLLTGLRSGELQRLVVMVDGPHPPGRPGTRALANVSPTLGFKTGLLRWILGMGIRALPLAHYWEGTELVLEWGDPLTSDGESQIAGVIEYLLRRHPEQWLNWTAASLRT